MSDTIKNSRNVLGRKIDRYRWPGVFEGPGRGQDLGAWGFTAFVGHLYRAMHYSAKRGINCDCMLSVRPSVCPSLVRGVGGL